MDRSGTGPQPGLSLGNVALRINLRSSLQINHNENHANNHPKEAWAKARLDSPGKEAWETAVVEVRGSRKRSGREDINQ